MFTPAIGLFFPPLHKVGWGYQPGGCQPGGISQGYFSLQAGDAQGCIWSVSAALEPGFDFEFDRINSADKVTLPFMKLTHLVMCPTPADWRDSRHGLPRPGDG